MGAEQVDMARWLNLIEAEYREIPGLNLTKRQMQRLWGLDPCVCDALVEALVAAGVLRRAEDGSYLLHSGSATTLVHDVSLAG